MTVLRSPRLVLRPWQPSDLEPMVLLANNRAVSKNLRDRFPYPYTHADALYWTRNANIPQPQQNFAIEWNQKFIGGLGFTPGQDIHRKTAEIGYWLGEPYWGQGFMSEAIEVSCTYAFQELDVVRIFAGVFENNPGSGRALLKAGFCLESIQKKAAIKDEQILDQWLYVKTV